MTEANSGTNWGEPPAYGGVSADAQEYAAMPDAQPDAAGPHHGAPAQGGSFMNIFAAGLSLVLLVGMGVWGYRLAVRDVTGVPVVRAMGGPMRVQPEDPGGEEAAYQGYSVNAVQGLGGAEAPAETLALAPRNTGVAPEDLPPGSVSSMSAAPVATAQAAPEVPQASPMPSTAPSTDPEAEMLALADQIAAGVEPLSQVTPTSAPSAEATLRAADQVVAQVVAAPQIIPGSVPGVSRSPRPTRRPSDLATRVAAPPVAVVPAANVVELAAAEIAPGTQLVQLGAFDSPEIARAEWDRLASRFEDYFGGKQRVVVQASQGGRAFWRLRANGFDTIQDARRFCAVLNTARAPCIPVVTR